MNRRAYQAIMRLRFMLLMQYRIAALAGITTQFMFGFVKIMVLEAFYLSTTQPQPLTFQQAVGYVWLGQAMLRLLPWDGDGEIQALVRSGNVAYELCRPLDLYSHWYARAIALRVAPTLLRAVPVFLVTLFVLPPKYALSIPTAGGWAAWILSTLGAIALGCAITNLINISMFWTISGEGISRLIPAVVIILSGMGVPLPLFPDWSQRLLELLPFAGLVDTPARFFTGQLSPTMIWVFLARQLVWTAILIIWGRRLLARGLRRVVVQGG
ncbi:MAG: ABC transporter permease [Firmicutes bacterium]|jgi:ABC-2 type transport system permease protein|nr:ABC transporter permease [Bacillota bacterium]